MQNCFKLLYKPAVIDIVIAVANMEKGVWVRNAILIYLHPVLLRKPLTVLVINGLYLLF